MISMNILSNKGVHPLHKIYPEVIQVRSDRSVSSTFNKAEFQMVSNKLGYHSWIFRLFVNQHQE